MNSASETPHAEEPPSKKRCLDFVKCENCRTDKQKCTPMERSWPDQKCDRCIKKDLPCSEGRRKKRSTKHDKIVDSTMPHVAKQLPGIEPRQSTFLIAFHKIMLEALRRLQDLRDETRTIFAPTLSVERFLELGGDSDELKLERFCQKLNTTVIRHWRQKLVLCKIQEQPLLLTSLLGHMLSQDFHTGAPYSCSLCEESEDEEDILEEMRRLGDSASEFLARSRRLRDHTHCVGTNMSSLGEADQLLRLAYKVRTQALNDLKDLNLSEHMPPMSRENPVIFPESLPKFHELWGSHNLGNRVDVLGRTWLHLALDGAEAFHDRLDTAGLLEGAGTDIKDMQDILGRSPLHIACQKGFVKLAIGLINKGAYPDFKSTYGLRPLHYAASIGSSELCTHLVGAPGVDINATDATGTTSLCYAVKRSHEHIVKLLVSDPRIDPNRCSGDKYPLIAAARRANVKIARLLLDAGANPNAQTDGYSALGYAARLQNLPLMELLGRQQHIRYDMPEKNRKTPLVTAIESNFLEGVRYLSQRSGVNLNIEDELGRTPIMLAARAGHFAIVQLLSRLPRVNLGQTDHEGRDAITLAQEREHNVIVGLLTGEARSRADQWNTARNLFPGMS